MDGLGLAEAVRALRAELLASRADGEGEDIRFGLGEITVELKAVISKTGNGKLGWKIIEVGGSVASEATQTITLTLTPVAKDPGTGKYEPAPLVAGHLDAKRDNRKADRSVQQNRVENGGESDPDAAPKTLQAADDDGPVDE